MDLRSERTAGFGKASPAGPPKQRAFCSAGRLGVTNPVFETSFPAILLGVLDALRVLEPFPFSQMFSLLRWLEIDSAETSSHGSDLPEIFSLLRWLEANEDACRQTNQYH
jgi:hypothetical protein